MAQLKRDIFDELDNGDVFDEIELPTDEKIRFSEEIGEIIRERIGKEIESMPIKELFIGYLKGIISSDESKEVVRSKIRKEMASMPIGKVAGRIMARELYRQEKSSGLIKEMIKSKFQIALEEFLSSIDKVKEEFKDFEDKVKKGMDAKYKEISKRIDSQDQYVFGGFSPHMNDLIIGDPATDGSWRIVKSGNNLVVERLESGAWVEKGGFEP